ncbi:MAG: hypothetical protein HYT08_03855 [Candidatus Levybacteria bacterium]|nr:hypothetical protein [Candidatus Levybacteria bacterium]
MGLKEKISRLLHRPPSSEEIMQTTEEIKGQIDVAFHIRELNGDKDTLEVKKLLEEKKIGVAFLATKEAEKCGPFFVIHGTTGIDTATILLCSSILAYRSSSGWRKISSLNQAISDAGRIARAMISEGFRMDVQDQAISNLLIRRGLWNPNEAFGIIPENK